MQTVILHIGTHKTGTTSVQHFLSDNREELWKHGILYPQTGLLAERKGEKGQHLLPQSILKQSSDRFQIWDAFRNEAIDAAKPVVIVSAEGFCKLDGAGIRELRQHLNGFEVKILVYFRRPFAYAVSAYKHMCRRASYSASLLTYVKENITIFDYPRILSLWADNFGAQNVVIRLFDQVIEGSGVIMDIIEFLDIPFQNLQKEKMRNRSVSNDAVTALVFLHAVRKRFVRIGWIGWICGKLLSHIRLETRLGRLFVRVPAGIWRRRWKRMEREFKGSEAYRQIDSWYAEFLLATGNVKTQPGPSVEPVTGLNA